MVQFSLFLSFSISKAHLYKFMCNDGNDGRSKVLL